MKVTIVDSGCGNIISLKNALEHLGAEVEVTFESERILSSSKLIMPGVGAFGFGMENLRRRGLDHSLSTAVLQNKTPILGICLGAQLMLQESEESPNEKGLGWIPGRVRKIDSQMGQIRVPHVGWDETRFLRTSCLADEENREVFYYTHSFFMDVKDESMTIGTCEYGSGFTAVFRHNNIYGCQFHPEKSQRAGLNLLTRYLQAD